MRANGSLFCFPPAGAGAGFYRELVPLLSGIEVVTVQLPGREERYSEFAWVDPVAIGRAVAEAILAEPFGPIYLMGYSYGALLAFETALALEARGQCVAGLIACARAAPSSAARAKASAMSDEALLAYVQSLGGLPADFEGMQDLLSVVMPALRADFAANEARPYPANVRVHCAMDTILGRHDPEAPSREGAAWARRTLAGSRNLTMPGGHFFIHEDLGRFAAVIKDCVT